MNFVSNIPLYIQISDYYAHLIETGIFKNGDMLPSIREVAFNFNINPQTVFNAYDLLIKKNYIKSIYKKGYMVIINNAENKEKILKEKIDDLLNLGFSKDEIISFLNNTKSKEKHHD